ncbi:hypothetical protein J7J58_06865 [candidate division WOR-3 bacterium]|nr:hypothetical protein [candidate division WOR-3 bacterium]
MKRIILFVMLFMMMLLVGCTKVSYRTEVECVGPNWTSDGKVEYLKLETVWKHSINMVSEKEEVWSAKSWLCEENADGSGKEEKGLVFDNPHQFLNVSSSSGEWVVFDNITKIEYERFTEGEIWVMKRDGSGLQKVGSGLYPDLSPDGSKIVYMKPRQGIWIMNRDGSDDHQIVSDTTASYPAWSPDDTLIAYISFYSPYSTIVTTNNGTKTDSFTKTYFYDWGGAGTNLIYCGLWSGKDVSINLNTGEIDSTNIIQNIYRCSRNGEYFICEDSNYYVIKKDGTNKHYIEP